MTFKIVGADENGVFPTRVEKRLVTALNVKGFGAIGDGVANDTTPVQDALAAASASSYKPAVYFPAGKYRLTSALTPFTGMRLLGPGRGSEFSAGAVIRNLTTDMFTPTADVSDMHFEGIQFEGDTANKDTDWWTVGTGFQILYTTVEKAGFTGFRRVYHGNWTGVTFKDFYCNGSDTTVRQFNIGGADNVFGPAFIASSGFKLTTLTASVTAGAAPKTITVADATGAVIGNPIYIGNQSDGASATRDATYITNIAGNTLTIGTLANAHSSGEYVHIVLDTAAVESSMSHSKIDRLYISPGPGMALHVTGGHSSTFINCELSGAPATSAGPGLYVLNSRGHQFIGTVASMVALKPWNQFNGAIVIYDSTDISFTGTIFDNIITSPVNLFRAGRSGAGGAPITDRIKIAGTTRFTVAAAAVLYSENSTMAATPTTIICDELAGLLLFNAQTGTTYTLALTDAGRWIELSNASAITVTVPTNASIPFPVGTQIHLMGINAGQVTVVGAGGVTVNGSPGLKLLDQYSAATLIKRATDTWRLVGRLSA